MPTFSFSSEPGATLECRLGAAPFAACASPHTTSPLADGPHTFEVRATDASGNTDPSPAVRSFTVDTVAPQTTITGQSANPSNSTSATFTFIGSDNEAPQAMIGFECRLDSLAESAFVSCSSPRVVSQLTQGAHTFQVRAVDLAGNRDLTPAIHTWTKRVTAPNMTITAAPPGSTTSTSATFNFNSSESGSTFQCRPDGAAFAACTWPREYTGLAVGGHQFQVRAIDAAGNVDGTPAVHNWTIQQPGSCTASTVTAAANAYSLGLDSSATSNYGNDGLKVDTKSGADARSARSLRATVAAERLPRGRCQAAPLRVFVEDRTHAQRSAARRIVDGGCDHLEQPAGGDRNGGDRAVRRRQRDVDGPVAGAGDVRRRQTLPRARPRRGRQRYRAGLPQP